MATTVDGRARRLWRPTRRVAVAASFVAVMFAGGVASGMNGNDSNGRNGDTQPGPPSDVPASPPVDIDGGRGASDVGKTAGKAPIAPGSQSQSADHARPAINGRGGVDPAAGPLPAAASQVAAEVTASLDVGVFDTDSGLAPEPGPAAQASAVAEAPGPPIDQDVPGAPTGGPPGRDRPSKDADR